MPSPPVISVTTDFGLKDPFVGVMKGVIAGICPSANVIDITHSIPSYHLLEGALAIWQAWRYFPAQTIHLVIVDPGVGSSREALLAHLGDAWFVAPDNGVLTLIEREIRKKSGTIQYWRIHNPEYRLPAQGATFHGRDIFAPAAAHLASQLERDAPAPETFGPKLEHAIQLSVPEPVQNPDGSIEGVILKSDTFGNLLTNIPSIDIAESFTEYVLELDSLRIPRFCRFFAEGAPNEIVVIPGSAGLLEIVMNQGSALEETGISPGTKFQLRAI